MRAALTRERVPWIPVDKKTGEVVWPEVYGEVIDLTEIEATAGGNTRTVPQVVLLDPNEDREIQITGYHTSLAGQIYASEVEVGDLFGAKFLGSEMSATRGVEYYNYKVAVFGADGKPKRRRRRFGADTTAQPSAPAGDYDDYDEPPEGV
jgi:hypothetical protein